MAVTTEYLAQIYMKVDGTPVDVSLRDDLRYCHVESTVHLPDLATLQFNNQEFSWGDREAFRIGQKLEIELGYADLKRTVFKGEITSMEVVIGIEGDFGLVVRAYDKAHRLHRGRFTRTFLNSTDSDIAKKIARELGLDSDIKATTEVYEYVLQHNQTDWEFLRERASRLGFELQVSDNTLIFKPPPSVPAEPLTLALRDELLSFRARVTTGEQVNEVEVRGWDPVNKKVVSGTAERPDQLPEVGMSDQGARTGGKVASDAFRKDAKVVVAHQPIYNPKQARSLAKTVLNDLSSAFITAEGVALGDPRLRLGSEVTIERVGQQFSGKYVVTQARHRYEQGGYRIEFEVTGRRATDLGSLIQTPAESGSRVHVYVGIVTDTNDPDNLGRVKVRLPALSADTESFWLRMVTPDAGKDRGFQFTPEIDDEVLVMGTDIDRLYILGALWNRTDTPPLPSSDVSGGQVDKRIMKSRTGHFFLFDDSQGGGGVQIVDSKGNKIVVNTARNSIEITAAGDIKIDAKQNLELTAGQSVKIKAGTGISIDAGTQLDLQGTTGVAVQSSTRVAISAQNVSLGA